MALKLILEERKLFDASLAVTAHAADPDHDHHKIHVDNGTTAIHADKLAPAASSENSNDAGTKLGAHRDARISAPPAITEILFVDPRVANWQSLTQGISNNVQVIVIDTTKDGLTQVTQDLRGYKNITSIQFLTYGKSGQIELGSSTIDSASLLANQAEVASWSRHLATGADVLLWGCDVGAGPAGQNFINTLHDLTGATVGASTDATGSVALGGDWTLEASTGALNVKAPFTDTAVQAYNGVLDTAIPTVTLTGPASGSILLGSTFTETVTFQNTATSGVGYGPFIDLFVPASSASGENATLSSATFLGQTVTVTEVDLSTNVAGHSGILGADHPLALDSGGNPLFIQAPTGYHAGDRLYVLTLPFGSFTPGQPAASITLNFSLASISNLSSSGALNISAEGGFQYGSDPLNDPTTDPSIRGINGSASTSGTNDGLVAVSDNVTLVNIIGAVTTNPGEGEDATGPSFPDTYVITITPAPVTQTDAITNLTLNLPLPDNVQYNGGTITISGASGSVTATPSTSTPGGTVSVDISSLAGSGNVTTISIPIYVPQNDSTSTPVLSTSSGAPVTIDPHPTYNYTADNWTPLGGAYTNTAQTVSGSGPVDGSGNATDLSFIAKSLAVQVTSAEQTDVGATGLTPGDEIAYTIHFQLSDYFNLNNLVLTDILGDGATLDNTVAPTLSITRSGTTTNNLSFGSISDTDTTVNGQTVVTSGSNSSWNYSRDNVTTGQTSLTFNVGSYLQNQLGTSLLTGSTSGTYGTLTFYAKALDKYTNTLSLQSLREADTITNSSTGTGTLINPAGGAVIGSISDNSSVTNTVPQGNLVLSIVALNGVAASAGTVSVNPGDNVTYELTYNLTTGDYGSLNLSGFVPLPVYTVPGSLTADNVDTYPTVNDYKLVSAPAGGTISSVTTSSSANSVNFNLGTLDDTSNSAGQKVDIYFTLTASNKPFADGLALTTEGQSHYTNAASNLLASTVIKQQTLSEPSLTEKSGIVGLANDANTAKTGTYVVDGTGTSGDPTSIFKTAQTTADGTSSSVFVGSIPTTIGNAENLNLSSGSDASDSIRIADTVQNTGHGNAYDVTLSDALPAGYTVANVTNLQITRGDGTVLTYTKPDGSAATASDFFSGTGILVNGAGGGSTPALFATGDTSHRDILYVTYDLKLSSSLAAETTLTNTGKVINWASVAGGVAGGNGFVTNGIPVGGTASALIDTATDTTSTPTLTKTATAGDDTGNVALNNVVVGETVTYQTVLTVPQGQITGSDVVITDVLPANMSYIASSENTVFGSGVSASGGTPGVSYDAPSRTLTIDLGSTLTSTTADTPGTVTFTYQAQLLNGSNANNTSLVNVASLGWSHPAISAQQTLTEKDPAVTTVITANKSSPLYSGETVTYTLTLTNTGGGSVPAQDLADTISIPTGLTFNNDLAQTGGTSATVNASAGSLAITQLVAGASATFTFTATVNNNLPANQAENVTASTTWTSMPGTVTNERSYSGSGSKSLSVGQLTPVISIIGEANNTDGLGASFASTPQTAVNATIGDIVRVHAYVQLPEGSNAASVLDFALPAGLQYFNDGTTKIALASPNGDITSSTIDPAGNTAVLQVTEGGTAITPSTYTPTYTFPGGSIDTSTSGHVKLNLGTVSNNDNSSVANYIVVEFNAIVANTSGNVDGTALASNLTIGGQTSGNATVTVQEPHVTLTKTITNVASGVVTYQEVLTNTGDATATNVTFDDPLSSSNQGTIAGESQSGTATSLSVTSSNGTSDLHATMNLAAGASETFTYHTTVANAAAPVTESTSTVSYVSLSSASETLSGSSTGTAGSSTGERTGQAGPSGSNGGVNNYDASASVGLGIITGRVWQDLGGNFSTYTSPDTALSGVTVSATTGSVVQTTATAADGTYSFLVPDGATSIALPAVGNNGLPANETLAADPFGTVPGNPATASLTTASANTHNGVNFVFQTPDTAPTITNPGSGTPINFIAGGSPVLIFPQGASVADSEINLLGNNYNGVNLTIERYNSSNSPAPDSSDLFAGYSLTNPKIASVSQVGGVLHIIFVNGTTAADIHTVLGQLTYANTTANSNQIVNGLKLGITIDDNNSSGTQGTGGDMTSAPAIVNFSLTPTSSNVTFTEPNDHPYTSAAVTVDGSLTLSVPSGTFSSATIQITGNLHTDQDILLFTNTAGMGNITGSYNASTGILTLTSSGNTATVGQWQTALQSVTYANSSDTPITTQRAVTFVVTGTASGTASTAAVSTVTIIPVNDSPILDNGIPVALSESSANIAEPPHGALGTLVSTLIGAGSGINNVVDPDGANVHDGQTVTSPGIAIISADTTLGSWWYTTNGGATWTKFAAADIPALSATNALHLSGDATNRVYFEPSGGGAAITVTNALSFRAWDQADGVANGTLSALPNDSAFGSGINTRASAYSSAIDTLAMNIRPNSPFHPPVLDTSPLSTSFLGFSTNAGDANGFQSLIAASRPQVNDLYLLGSANNRYVIVEQMMVVAVPPNIFYHSDKGEKLAFEASRPDGSPLPSWMFFDRDTLTFSGTPPKSAHGTIDILITAKDSHGHKAEATFTITLGDNAHKKIASNQDTQTDKNLKQSTIDKLKTRHNKPHDQHVFNQPQNSLHNNAAINDAHHLRSTQHQSFTDQLRQTHDKSDHGLLAALAHHVTALRQTF